MPADRDVSPQLHRWSEHAAWRGTVEVFNYIRAFPPSAVRLAPTQPQQTFSPCPQAFKYLGHFDKAILTTHPIAS